MNTKDDLLGNYINLFRDMQDPCRILNENDESM
jgi:hypothetical protein